ncbi:MAG: heme exporter protein CcmD [Methylovirgula sp.]
MTNDPYFGFILAAYLVAFVIVAFMIVATLVDYRTLRQALGRLAARTGRAAED